MNKVFRYVHPVIFCLICIFGVTAISGCMSPMALKPKSKTLDLTTNSVGLFTLRTSNQYKPSFQPGVQWFEVISQETGKAVNFEVYLPHRKEKKRFFEYLISVDLPPGTYTLGDVVGQSLSFPFVANFQFPVKANFDLPPNAVVYLGHVNMVNRKRNKGEPRSGPGIPLIDQAASGYPDSTFDISISDKSDSDIPLFKQTYPVLQNYSVTKAIMKR